MDFTEFQAKVIITGKASITQNIEMTDENGNPIIREVFYQGDSFWGSSHTWDFELPENINVQNFMMKDDNKYIYFSYKVDGQIDFSQNPNLPSNYNYDIYLDTLDVADKGYIGSWWKTSFGVNYRISNSGIFKWDDNCTDRKDSSGWKWIGSAGMTYKLSPDKKVIEYRIKKESLGGLEAKDLNVYMYVEDPKTNIGNLIQPISDGVTEFKGSFTYTQKSYKMKTPHGWYCSEEKNMDLNDGYVSLVWDENLPTGTAVKAWIRTRQENSNWSNWQEVNKGKAIQGTFNKVQYCFGLYTNDGGVTPQVSGIKLYQYQLTENPVILTGDVSTYINFPIVIATENTDPITISITGPYDYNKTHTYYREDKFFTSEECFTYPGDYTITVDNAGKETVKNIKVGLSAFDEAYQLLEITKHYEYGMVMAADSGDTKLYSESQQYALYTMYALMNNSIVIKDAYVHKYLATRLLDGDVLNISDVHNIKNALMQSDVDASRYFAEWEQKREAERDSLAISMIPIIGSIKGFYDAIQGYDTLTGRKLTWWESAINIVSISLDAYAVGKLADIALLEPKATSLWLNMEVISGRMSKTVAESISKIERGLSDIRFTGKIEKTAEELNAFWKSNGYVNPPYKLDIPAYQIKLTEETSFVKVYDGVNSNEYGQFVMKLEDITNADGSFLTAQQIKDKYALEFLPKYVADAKIPAGTTMNCGIAGPIEGWGSGGRLQFDLNWQKIGNFTYKATLGN